MEFQRVVRTAGGEVKDVEEDHLLAAAYGDNDASVE